MLDAGSSNEHGVAVLAFHERVVRNPAEGDLRHGQVVLLRDSLDLGKGAEVGLFPVTRTVALW